MSCIVADSSPLIALAWVDLLYLPSAIYGPTLIPQTVLNECLVKHEFEDAQRIVLAVKNQWLIESPDPVIPHMLADRGLDAGETAALALAMDARASILIDELRGRRAAKELGIPLIGVGGLLLQAKRKKLVPQVIPLLQVIKASGYFISDALLVQIRKLADE